VPSALARRWGNRRPSRGRFGRCAPGSGGARGRGHLPWPRPHFAVVGHGREPRDGDAVDAWVRLLAIWALWALTGCAGGARLAVKAESGPPRGLQAPEAVAEREPGKVERVRWPADPCDLANAFERATKPSELLRALRSSHDHRRPGARPARAAGPRATEMPRACGGSLTGSARVDVVVKRAPRVDARVPRAARLTYWMPSNPEANNVPW
jgi:hypothetical protein